MGVARNFLRLQLQRLGIRTRRGVRGQPSRHIIKRGIRHARKVQVGNEVSYKPGLFPVELHATKGWRNVPRWS